MSLCLPAARRRERTKKPSDTENPEDLLEHFGWHTRPCHHFYSALTEILRYVAEQLAIHALLPAGCNSRLKVFVAMAEPLGLEASKCRKLKK